MAHKNRVDPVVVMEKLLKQIEEKDAKIESLESTVEQLLAQIQEISAVKTSTVEKRPVRSSSAGAGSKNQCDSMDTDRAVPNNVVSDSAVPKAPLILPAKRNRKKKVQVVMVDSDYPSDKKGESQSVPVGVAADKPVAKKRKALASPTPSLSDVAKSDTGMDVSDVDDVVACAVGDGADADRNVSSMDKMVKDSTPTYADKARKIPPINVHGQEQWRALSGEIAKCAIITKAVLIKDGIRIFPATAEDYRKISKLLLSMKKQFHTYAFSEEKKIYAVIRGLPHDADTEEVRQELADQQIDAEVFRMTSRKTKKPLPLLLVKTSNKNVFKVSRLYNLVIKVEPKKKNTEPGQCFRCQRYGHAQSRCNYKHRCVKCSGDHPSVQCKLQKPEDGTRNAKCVLCGESGHPASYKGCPKFPRKFAPETTKTVQPVKNTRAVAKESKLAEGIRKQKTMPVTTSVQAQILNVDQGSIVAAIEAYLRANLTEIIRAALPTQ